MAVEITQFDLYTELDSETRAFVQEEAQAIRVELKRTVEGAIGIGKRLIAVKDRLPHGMFLPWLHAEFELSERTAQNFMHAARTMDLKSAESADLAVSLLHEPHAVIQMVETGQIAPTLPAIREAKREMQTEHVPVRQFIDEVFPGFTQWQADQTEEKKETEETRYQTAVDMGMTEYYYADLRRAAIQNDREMRESKAPIKSATLTVLQSSESNEWFTPAVYVDAARELMGGIDVDPASCEFANRTVQAATYYDITTNGLEREWRGRVWLNPPYGRDGGDSNQEIWSRRLIEQYDAGIVTEAVLLVNAVPGNKWFQPLWRFILCFPDHRIRFYNQETDASQPTHSNALIYLGEQHERFDTLFSQFGAVVKRFRS